MAKQTRLTPQYFTDHHVALGYHQELNPDRYDFVFDEEGGCTAVPLRWWDTNSYLAYQAGAAGWEEDETGPDPTQVRCPRCLGDGFYTVDGIEEIYDCPQCHGARTVAPLDDLPF